MKEVRAIVALNLNDILFLTNNKFKHTRTKLRERHKINGVLGVRRRSKQSDKAVWGSFAHGTSDP